MLFRDCLSSSKSHTWNMAHTHNGAPIILLPGVLFSFNSRRGKLWIWRTVAQIGVRKMCHFFLLNHQESHFQMQTPVFGADISCREQCGFSTKASDAHAPMPCLNRKFSLVYRENLIPKDCTMSYLTKWAQQSVLQNFPLNFTFKLHWTENRMLDRTDSSPFQRVDKPAYQKALLQTD